MNNPFEQLLEYINQNENIEEQKLMCAERTGDFHLGDSRQPTRKSILLFDLVS